MSNTYWSSNGKYQEWYQANYSNLVPDNSAAPTLAGEMLRAACRLYYDYYNNGMCNNTSGAAKFLVHYDIRCDLGVAEELHDIALESNTGSYTLVELSRQLEAVFDAVIEFAQTKSCKDYNYDPEHDNFWSYQDNDWSDSDFDNFMSRVWDDDYTNYDDDY